MPFPVRLSRSTTPTPRLQVLDSTYGRDKSHSLHQRRSPSDADVASFALLDRPGFAKDRHHVYQRDRVISDDPAHFELLDGELAKDSHVVYWSDGSVLSEDPTHFAIVSTADHYLYTKDARAVHVNGNPIPGPIPRHSKSCKALTRGTPNVSSTSTNRSPTPTSRRSGRSTAPTQRLRTRLLDGQDDRRRRPEYFRC